jgi:hypothetical protein
MNKILFVFLLFSCQPPKVGTYTTEKAYVGKNGQYRIDTTFYIVKKGKYIYTPPKKEEMEDDSNPALEQFQRDLIFGD